MSVDVFPTMTRTAERPGGPCPAWCTVDHGPARSDDGVHTNDPLAVELSTDQHDQAEYIGGGYSAVLVDVQQYPGKSPFVMLTHHDGMADPCDPLTADQAVKVAEALEWNAEIVRACGTNTCWCDGLHAPREDHWGERKEIPLTLTSLDYIPQVNVVISRPWKAKAAFVELVSHNERMWDRLTADEAEQLAKHLRRSGAIVALHQAVTEGTR